jgi:hypothetical protein
MPPQSVELLSNATNCAVVRVPGRRFPGVVVQGDTLRALADLSAELIQRGAGSADAELEEVARTLHERLSALIAHYEATLQHHRLPLPYPARAEATATNAETYAE